MSKGGLGMEQAKQPLILIVDDEERMRRIITDYLRIKGYDTIEAVDGVEAVELFKKHNPDLILLDVMMPRMDGWEVCRIIHESSKVPIIMLTARGQEEDELHGFSLGADEYISKPFSLKILLARIEAVFRRINGASGVGVTDRSVPGLTINREGREVCVDGNPDDLTFTEFELLSFLMDNPGIALSRDKILDSVWRYDYYGDARTVDTHVKKLRGKLGGRGDLIKTIRGIGYKFEI